MACLYPRTHKSGTNGGITGSAVALAAAVDYPNVRQVVVQADPGNTDNLVVGEAGGQNFVLTPNNAISIPTSDISDIYVKSAGGTQRVNWIAYNVVAEFK